MLAILGAIVGLIFVAASLSIEGHKGWSLAMLYVGVDLVYGGLYYSLYSADPKRFLVPEEVLQASSVQQLVELKGDVEGTIVALSELDIFIEEFLSSKDYRLQTLAWGDSNADWKRLSPNFFGRARRLFSRVGPQRDEYVFNFFFDLRRTGQAGQATFFIGSSDQGDLSLSGNKFVTELAKARSAKVAWLDSLYTKYRSFNPFELPDFYYFSFTIIGAADIIAISRLAKALVVSQIIVLVFLGALITEREKSDLTQGSARQ